MNSQEQWTGHTCSTNCNVQPIRKVVMQLRPEFVNLKIMVQQKRSLIQKKDKYPSDIYRTLTLNDSACSDTGQLVCLQPNRPKVRLKPLFGGWPCFSERRLTPCKSALCPFPTDQNQLHCCVSADIITLRSHRWSATEFREVNNESGSGQRALLLGTFDCRMQNGVFCNLRAKKARLQWRISEHWWNAIKHLCFGTWCMLWRVQYYGLAHVMPYISMFRRQRMWCRRRSPIPTARRSEPVSTQVVCRVVWRILGRPRWAFLTVTNCQF